MNKELDKHDEPVIPDYSTQEPKNPWDSGWRGWVMEFVWGGVHEFLVPLVLILVLAFIARLLGGC